MERRPQQAANDETPLPERERHLRVVGEAAMHSTDVVPLPLPDLSVTSEMERRLNWPTHRVAIQMWVSSDTQSHPRVLYRVSERLRGRHSASWFIPPNGVRIHFSLGDWEGNLDEAIGSFTEELGELLGADPSYTRCDRIPVDIPAALAKARELGIEAAEMFVAGGSPVAAGAPEATDLTSK
ncbi:hypothetical protein [Mycolicibacterium wolinskyi]|uniref:hypothetical protein n=1 Tax=Mycolicibacterium wolinskyi TaxID=59750 RepID=UPI003BAC89EE